MKASRNRPVKKALKKQKSSQKQDRPFAQYMRRKLAFTFAVVALALFVLGIVLMTIGRDNNEEYTKIIFSQQDYQTRTIAFRRGDILDRNGTVLATTTRLYNLILDPRIILSDEKYTDTTIDALVECYGYNRDELVALIHERSDSSYVIYTREMSEEDMNRFVELKAQIAAANSKKKDKTENKKRVAGVWFETKYKRIYPYNDLACWLLGFSRDDSSVGSYGIEQYYNDQLIGVNGREYGYLNDETDLERVIKPAEDGNTIVTTIDAQIQRIVQDKIAAAQEGLKAANIGVVVMDPHNGEVLAMASDMPFDCNDPSNIQALLNSYSEQEYTEETLNAMSQEEMVDALAGLWKNYCISYTYEPGSTAKSLTVAAALDEARISTSDTFVCDGGDWAGGWYISCNNGHAHGTQSLTKTLMESCNDALMQIARKLGHDNMEKYQKLFGFGKKTGIDLPGEENGLLNSGRDEATLTTNGFGQNFNVTMIQQAAAYCALVNGGTYYQPHIVRQIKNSSGAVLKEIDKVEVRQMISAETSAYLREALLEVVDNGTGKNARVDGYEVWGKTGTAEILGRDNENFLLSFIGGVPASDPQVILYVTVDRPSGVEKQAMSRHASTLWREIMTDILPCLNIYPTRPLQNPPETTAAPEATTEAQTGADGNPVASETDADGNPVTPETDADGNPVAPATDADGNPVTTQPPGDVQDTEDDFSGGIFTNPNAEPEGQADPANGDGQPGGQEPQEGQEPQGNGPEGNAPGESSSQEPEGFELP